MTFRNRSGPGGGPLLLGGLVALGACIAIVATRIGTPTPGVIAVAGALLVAGFTLTASGILALVSRPVWIEGTVVDTRWSIGGVRRIGVVVLKTAEPDELTLHLDYRIFTEIRVGDRLRVRHNSLNRAQVYAVEIIGRDQAGTSRA